MRQADGQALLPLRSLREVRERLRELEGRVAELHGLGQATVRRFRASYPDAPLYLTRYADRTLNDYRWRRSSARRWRGEGPVGVNLTLDLTGAAGQQILEGFPVLVQEAWLRYEGRRIELNLALALCHYERLRLRDYQARRRRIREIEAGWKAGPE